METHLSLSLKWRQSLSRLRMFMQIYLFIYLFHEYKETEFTGKFICTQMLE